MAIDFNKWNEQFGGADAVKALEESAKNEYTELPDGKYVCKLEKLELGESKDHKPMIKGQFRVIEGRGKNQCLFYNQVFCRSANGSGFPIHKGLEFLRSLQIFDDADVDFDGDYAALNDLLLDMAEEAEIGGMVFEVTKSHEGDYSRITISDILE